MFDIAPTELLVLGAVALIVIPPKDLPKAMRVAGYWVGRARGMARQFRSGFDDMIRDAELAEMEKKWRDENERIMREHPPTPALEAPVEHGPDAGADAALPEGEAPPVMVEKPHVLPAPEGAESSPSEKAAS